MPGRTIYPFLFLWFCCSVTLPAQSPLRNGKDYAFLFYVADFKPGWPRLPETKEEVEAIAAELRDNYGFQTEVVPNPTKKTILDKIKAVNARSFGPNDQVLFFFSTHGYYNSAQD